MAKVCMHVLTYLKGFLVAYLRTYFSMGVGIRQASALSRDSVEILPHPSQPTRLTEGMNACALYVQVYLGPKPLSPIWLQEL